ncbi:GTPase [Candidatus Laterigemmans baculatus]|uniref:GTPase n=1 Tax=Candidatus Laterigemmans baculatus TaxID=2770505 RepID=UPI0013DC76EC|nr:GTPase [Candidatus Laterigemmans baculatus]
MLASPSLDSQEPVEAIRRAAAHVFGDRPAGRAIVELCDQHAEVRQRILDQRVPDATVIAVVGATGQGKSWLIRQLVENPAVRGAIRSGDAQQDATRRLYWVGPQPPAGLDERFESYLHCSATAMLDLGGPYLVVDTPGATDLDEATVAAANRALSMASVLILVIRREQLRSQTAGRIVHASEGTLVLPVINAVRSPDDDAELRTDVDALMHRLRAAAPEGEILPVMLVPDFDLAGRDEATIAAEAVEGLATRLRPQLALGDVGQRRRGLRLESADRQFAQQVREQLGDHLPRLTAAVDRLHEATRSLPHDVAIELIGSGGVLRAGIRSRLRAEMLVTTAAIWFPYRTLLGLLNLTHGAWDRVILAFSGSLPSLVTAAWSGVRNLADQRGTAEASTGAVRARSSAMVADRIVPLVNRFRTELARLRPQEEQARYGEEEGFGNPDVSPVAMLGIDSLQEEAQQIFEEEIARAAPTPLAAQLYGAIGTVIFWGLMAGPVVSLYRSYFAASYESLRELAGDLENFPHPSFGMVLTSLLLSLLPTALFAMLVLTWVQRRSKQERAAEAIARRLEAAIDRLQHDRVLRLELRDPLLEDAQRLIRAGDVRP